MERIHHGRRIRKLLRSGGFEAHEPVQCHDLDLVPPGLGLLGKPLLERLLGAAFDQV